MTSTLRLHRQKSNPNNKTNKRPVDAEKNNMDKSRPNNKGISRAKIARTFGRGPVPSGFLRRSGAVVLALDSQPNDRGSNPGRRQSVVVEPLLGARKQRGPGLMATRTDPQIKRDGAHGCGLGHGWFRWLTRSVAGRRRGSYKIDAWPTTHCDCTTRRV